MDCEQISEKAIELKINLNHIKIIKEPYNGWRIDTIKETKKITKLREYIKTK